MYTCITWAVLQGLPCSGVWHYRLLTTLTMMHLQPWPCSCMVQLFSLGSCWWESRFVLRHDKHNRHSIWCRNYEQSRQYYIYNHAHIVQSARQLVPPDSRPKKSRQPVKHFYQASCDKLWCVSKQARQYQDWVNAHVLSTHVLQALMDEWFRGSGWAWQAVERQEHNSQPMHTSFSE